jgi:hypothetical protein
MGASSASAKRMAVRADGQRLECGSIARSGCLVATLVDVTARQGAVLASARRSVAWLVATCGPTVLTMRAASCRSWLRVGDSSAGAGSPHPLVPGRDLAGMTVIDAGLRERPLGLVTQGATGGRQLAADRGLVGPARSVPARDPSARAARQREQRAPVIRGTAARRAGRRR